MHKLFVRVDAAVSWRSIILVVSFVSSIALVVPLANNKSLLDERFYWAAALFLFGIIYSILDRRYHYLTFDDSNLIINRLFRIAVVLPTSQLKKLSYESRAVTHVLVITYFKNGVEQSKDYEIRSHSTNTLIDLNEILRRFNPKLEISVDESSQKFLEDNKNLYLKNPTTKIGWLWFLVKWFLIGLIVCSAFVYWFVPKK